jgi:hypothetical protein
MSNRLSITQTGSLAKPNEAQVKVISSTIAKTVVDLSVTDLADKIENGHTWSAVFRDGARNADNWLEQSLFAADLDGSNMDLKQVVSICQRECIDPCIVHESFSSTPDNRKWRVIFQVDKPIVCPITAKRIQAKIQMIFGSDPSVVDIARIYYGTNKKCAIIDPEVYLDLDELEPLPNLIDNRLSGMSEEGEADYTEEIQSEVLGALSRANPGKFDLLVAILSEQKKRIQEVEEGSGYQSVFKAAVKLGKFKELYRQAILETIADWVDTCEAYSGWQHRNRLSEIVNKGIDYGRKTTFN